MAAMSVVRYVVTPSIRLDGTNARPTQRARSARARAIRRRRLAPAVVGLPDPPRRPPDGRRTRQDQDDEDAVADGPELGSGARSGGSARRGADMPAGRACCRGCSRRRGSRGRPRRGGPSRRTSAAAAGRSSRRRRRAGRRRRQEPEQPGARVRRPRAANRATSARDAQGQEGEGEQQQPGVQDRLAADPEQGRRRVGVGVSGQQGRLEEDHAGVPDRRRAAQQGQHHLGDHRLDEEQQRGADEHRQGEDDRQGGLLPIDPGRLTVKRTAG